MEKILIIRLKSIGDVVFTLPAVNALRRNFPAAKISFLTSEENADLLRGFRAVDEIIPLHRAALRSGNPLKMSGELFSLLKKLVTANFSLVVDFQGYGETAWLARLTRASERWGTVYRARSAWAYTRGILRDNALQIADAHLSLLQQCGIKTGRVQNNFALPPESLIAAQNFFNDQSLYFSSPTLFIQAFTSTPHKNWGLKNFLLMAKHSRACGRQIIFSGGPKEAAALEQARAAGFAIAAGLPLLTAAGLMQLSTVILGGVTGLVHLAVALQKRVVMLVGAAESEPGLPYQHHDWIVAPGAGTQMENIRLESVIAACDRAFSESAGSVLC